MLLGERDVNTSGRTSRGSSVSAASASCGLRGSTATAKVDMLYSAPGVASMLKTSTEVGNLGGLTIDSFGMPNTLRAPRRGGATSRLSTGSSHSNNSSRTHAHHAWPSSASASARLSKESMVPQYLPDTLSPTVMNLPGSSPLIPRARGSLDAHRSLSMTMADTSEPTFRFSGNRSLTSLRSHDPIQRPKDQVKYPARLRRTSHRSISPALGDAASSYPPRVHNQGMPPYAGPMRRRTPSDMSMRRKDRGFVISGMPGRDPRPIFYNDLHPDIPPVPPLVPHRNAAIEQPRKSQKYHKLKSHKSVKASVSSRSTNQRADSDPASSDGPSPPTPKDGASIEALVSPASSQPFIRVIRGVPDNKERTSGPSYYDYSEDFVEQGQVCERESGVVPTGHVHHIKTIIEERGAYDNIPKRIGVSTASAIEISTIELPDIAELPASPVVVRRITRDLVLATLAPMSTTGDVDTSEELAEAGVSGQANGSGEEGLGKSGISGDEHNISLQLHEVDKNRYSILSQAGSSVLNSSTLNFAAQNLISMAVGNNTTIETDNGNSLLHVHDAEPTTEDGMTELLDGYQHTDTKKESEEPIEEIIAVNDSLDKRSKHAANSSDEQSFKSCTNLPELTENSLKDVATRSFTPCEDLPRPGPPFKDSDAKSFKTCKDTITPERAMSMPASRLPTATSESQFRRPFSEMLPSPSLALDIDQPPPPASNSNTFKAMSKSQVIPMRSPKQSFAASSNSSSTNSCTPQPPAVPPRESSSSREAQRSNAVAAFLMRQLRPRFSKMTPSRGRKQAVEEVSIKQELEETAQDIPTPPPMRDRRTPTNATGSGDQPFEPTQKPKQETTQEEILPGMKVKTTAMHIDTGDLDATLSLDNPSLGNAPFLHREILAESSFSSQESPSEYSPEYSLSMSCVQSSLVPIPQTPERRRRDSQTTTHLSWPRHRSLNHPSTSGGDEQMVESNTQEDTTTDLRLPAYLKFPLNPLPDLKEESHEDSSLNTSASNIKNSSFPFTTIAQPDISLGRASVDDIAIFGKPPSLKLFRKSGLTHSWGLPSMNFSCSNLMDMPEVLDFRGSRSLEISPEVRKQLLGSELRRPSSANGMRKEHRGSFTFLDNISPERPQIADLFPKKLPLEHKALLEELERLDVPSVGGLTLRFSEIIPSLCMTASSNEFPVEEYILEHALEEVSEVGGPASKRSSARLRPMPGSPNMVVIDDAVYEGLTCKERVEGEGTHTDSGRTSSQKGHNRKRAANEGSLSVAHTSLQDKSALVRLESVSPAVLRTRSLSLSHPDIKVSSESRLSSRSLRSIVSTPTATVTDTRPWNSDKNYPWATTDPSIDISLPLPTLAKQSPGPGPSHLRHRLSDASSVTTFSTERTPISPTSPTSNLSPSDPEGPYMHTRHMSHHRFGIFASSKRSNNPPTPGFDASGYPTGPVHVRGGDQSHGAGDRYPTSALTLPPNSHMMPASTSYISVDTSDDEIEPSSRKTRFSLKTRRNTKNFTPKAHPSRTHEVQQPSIDNSNPELNTTEFPLRSNRHTFSNAQGMSRLNYYKHKVVNSVKSLYHKGLNSVRNLSR